MKEKNKCQQCTKYFESTEVEKPEQEAGKEVF